MKCGAYAGNREATAEIPCGETDIISVLGSVFIDDRVALIVVANLHAVTNVDYNAKGQRTPCMKVDTECAPVTSITARKNNNY
jgi:hypothetical protein